MLAEEYDLNLLSLLDNSCLQAAVLEIPALNKHNNVRRNFLMTFRNTILITLSQLLFVLTYGQKVIEPVLSSRDTSTIVFRFHCAPTLSKKAPLLIINGDRFKSNTLQRHFFNI